MTLIQYAVIGQVGLITINRPEALNALNRAVLQELNEVLDAVDLETTRCLVITGAGEKAFVAGADIAEMCCMNESEARIFSETGNTLFRKIETFPIPVIAAVNGYALGGGNELALSCDIRICSENAVLVSPRLIWALHRVSGAPSGLLASLVQLRKRKNCCLLAETSRQRKRFKLVW